MKRTNSRIFTILILFFACFAGTSYAQSGCGANSALNGVYRIDVAASDRLYSVIEGASSSVPYRDQQQFFIDLAVRLTPPDLLAVECRGNRVSLGSSRARRVEFLADGVTRSARSADGQVVRSRIRFERGSLMFNSSGGDDLNFTFTPLDGGKRLRVTRRIAARQLIEPVVIQTVYNKIGETARWDIFDEAQSAEQIARQNDEKTPPIAARPTRNGNSDADRLRDALDEWIEATNRRDINRQMTFYMPQLQAFYLTRNASRGAVRAEKERVFAAARSVDIRAAEPEIIFQDGGRTAIMRFRKKYNVQGRRTQRGEVVQELRWRQTNNGWKIFSERDIRVIS
jgi:ketosteroid isomerase-like protein